MADWQKIKTEYITNPDTSYRELSQKYGVHYTNIAKRAKKEDWQQLRKQQANATQTKIIQAVERRKVDRAAKIMDVSDQLLKKIEELVGELDVTEASPKDIRSLSAAIKDIKEIQMIRSEADIREQEARIEKLRRETDRDDQSGTITVRLPGGIEDYAQ